MFGPIGYIQRRNGEFGRGRFPSPKLLGTKEIEVIPKLFFANYFYSF